MIRSTAAVLALSVGLLGGCGNEADAAGESQPGGTWELVELTIDGTPVPDAVLVMTLDLADAVFEGETACHTIYGSFTITDDGVSTFTLPGVDRSNCEPAPLALEDQTVTAMEAVTAWQLEGSGHLLLETTDRQTRLAFRPVG